MVDDKLLKGIKQILRNSHSYKIKINILKFPAVLVSPFEFLLIALQNTI